MNRRIYLKRGLLAAASLWSTPHASAFALLTLLRVHKSEPAIDVVKVPSRSRADAVRVFSTAMAQVAPWPEELLVCLADEANWVARDAATASDPAHEGTQLLPELAADNSGRLSEDIDSTVLEPGALVLHPARRFKYEVGDVCADALSGNVQLLGPCNAQGQYARDVSLAEAAALPPGCFFALGARQHPNPQAMALMSKAWEALGGTPGFYRGESYIRRFTNSERTVVVTLCNGRMALGEPAFLRLYSSP